MNFNSKIKNMLIIEELKNLRKKNNIFSLTHKQNCILVCETLCVHHVPTLDA